MPQKRTRLQPSRSDDDVNERCQQNGGRKSSLVERQPCQTTFVTRQSRRKSSQSQSPTPPWTGRFRLSHKYLAPSKPEGQRKVRCCCPIRPASWSLWFYRVSVVPPQSGQSFEEPGTTQPPPPYSTISTRQPEVAGGHVGRDQRFEDTYFDDLENEPKRSCFHDCMMHDGACTWCV